jgi:hypothetical protein
MGDFVMPRTPAPLTVERDFDGDWIVCRDENVYVASFREEADARAFVALPALIEAARAAVAWFDDASIGTDDWKGVYKVFEPLEAALAQADGPKEQP